METHRDEPHSDQAKAALAALYSEAEQRGTDGAMHAIDSCTRISIEQGKLLYDIVRDLEPERCCEVGMAYGFSTLFILAALADNEKGRHVAIDPGQNRSWHGIGLEKVREAGLSHLLEFHEETSFAFWPRMIAEGRKFDFVFIDGDHRFDGVMIDVYGATRSIAAGGVIVLDDMWMPSVRTAVSFLETNLTEFSRMPSPIDNAAVFRHTGQSVFRDWDHFALFRVG